jgi:FAD:protein FMN transferase
MRRVRFAAMGTEILLRMPDRAPIELEEAVQELFERREATLSRFRPESELSRLNAAAGRPVPVGPLLRASIASALAAARATGGVFDPCLGGHMVALGYDRPFAELPAVQPAAAALHATGGAWRDVELDVARSRVRIPRGAALDLGGIAKGATADAAAALLRGAGLPWALVSAGGDLAIHGRPPGSEGWSLAIALPEGEERITLRHGALATSGVSRRRWQQGTRARHHLLDPRSGLPARTGLWSASVVAATAEQAEVAATVAFVLGAEEGAAFLRARGLPGLLVPLRDEPVRVGAWPGPGPVERRAA